MAPTKITPQAFSLLELVIVLAVLGTLLTIAVPYYQQYIQRANRADAISTILSVAECQGRIRTQTGFFDTTRCLPATNATRYAFSIQPANELASDSYIITAEPPREQADSCGSLSLDHTGTRQVGNPAGSLSGCWGGR
mgnify:CR=1 FL=1